jgi:hypothetical protein
LLPQRILIDGDSLFAGCLLLFMNFVLLRVATTEKLGQRGCPQNGIVMNSRGSIAPVVHHPQWHA